MKMRYFLIIKKDGIFEVLKENESKCQNCSNLNVEQIVWSDGLATGNLGPMEYLGSTLVKIMQLHNQNLGQLVKIPISLRM